MREVPDESVLEPHLLNLLSLANEYISASLVDTFLALVIQSPVEVEISSTLTIKTKTGLDNDPANLEFLCRPCHYKKDRATDKGVSAVKDEFGYGI
jgi:hypothetical protein